MIRTGLLGTAALAITSCAAGSPDETSGSPYLFLFAGDADEKSEDFLAVIDLRPSSPTLGQALSTTPIGMKASMPHHSEYAMPPPGELLFLNAHHHETSMLVALDGEKAPRIEKMFQPPPPFRYPHDYTRTPAGTRLVGFLRSEGKWPDSVETADPGGQGGIAEYSADGVLLRTSSAAVAGSAKPVRPYAFALPPGADRIVVTSALMMENLNADVVQIFGYSRFDLLHTIPVPPAVLPSGAALPGSERAPFGPRVLNDGSVFFNTYGCGFYHLTDIASAAPTLASVFALDTPAPQDVDQIRGACGIPVIVDDYWIMPVGGMHMVLVLDISDPARPREVFRLNTPDHFAPHWLAKDEISDRLVLGAELGGEEGMYLLRIDRANGALSFDPLLSDPVNGPGYLTLDRASWPHGDTGPAWAHAALFLRK